MAPSNQRSTSAGGFIVAASLMVGTIIGLVLGQPSLGFVTGLGLGAVVAIALWLNARG